MRYDYDFIIPALGAPPEKGTTNSAGLDIFMHRWNGFTP
jgi:hypothetical protein